MNFVLKISKYKAFADNNIKVAEMMFSVFDREENILKKGEKKKLIRSILSFYHHVS